MFLLCVYLSVALMANTNENGNLVWIVGYEQWEVRYSELHHSAIYFFKELENWIYSFEIMIVAIFTLHPS